jgi:hypothetical protein
MVRTENDKKNSLICECFDKDLKLLDKSRRRDIKNIIDPITKYYLSLH